MRESLKILGPGLCVQISASVYENSSQSPCSLLLLLLWIREVSFLSPQQCMFGHLNLRQQMWEGPAVYSPVKPAVFPCYFIWMPRKQVDTVLAIVIEMVCYSMAVEALFASFVASVYVYDTFWFLFKWLNLDFQPSVWGRRFSPLKVLCTWVGFSKLTRKSGFKKQIVLMTPVWGGRPICKTV